MYILYLQYGAYFIRCSFCCCCCWCCPSFIGGWINATVAALLLLLLFCCCWGRCCRCCCCWSWARAVLPLPGLELATALLALTNQQLSMLGRACFNQAHPGQRGSTLELNVDANPQFRWGSTADRPHKSRLSFSTNCSVTAPTTGAEMLLINLSHGLRKFWLLP